MNLVATSDFRNPDPQLIEMESETPHEMHVPKGARFSIGGNLPFDKMTAAQKKLVVELNAAGRIIETSQKDFASKIDAEVKAEKEKAATPVTAGSKK